MYLVRVFPRVGGSFTWPLYSADDLVEFHRDATRGELGSVAYKVEALDGSSNWFDPFHLL